MDLVERVTRGFIGSEAHKRLFCESFLSTHRPFDPAEIRWPDLDAESLSRLKALRSGTKR